MVVIDASAILAGILGELGGDSVFEALDDAFVSAANVAEVYTYATIRKLPLDAIDAFFDESGVEIAAVDHKLAVNAGRLAATTSSAGLSLGDRCCLALAQAKGAEVLTADRPWAQFAAPLGLTITLLR